MANQLPRFIPRSSFPNHGSIPRSYFLGHHRAGLKKMQSMLSSIDYVIECRDFRIPVTSVNPMFEEALGNKRRLIVYTKNDLGQVVREPQSSEYQTKTEKIIQSFNPKTPVFFVDQTRRQVIPILRHLRDDAEGPDKLIGCRVLVVGMPNIGKSTLINNLRAQGVGKRKAAITGGQPGITRKVGTPVKILERDGNSDIYVVDTPGIFMPYVPNAESMIKLALCGCVKDSVIAPVTLADYLLYRINLVDTNLYYRWSHPTNDIAPLLNSYARYNGLLSRGATPNIDLAAVNFVQKWRSGRIGRFLLDNLRDETRRLRLEAEPEKVISITQALKEERLGRMQRSSGGEDKGK